MSSIVLNGQRSHAPSDRVGARTKERPRILVSVPHALVARDLLSTGLVFELADRGAELVILSPLAHEPRFTERFDPHRFHHEPIRTDRGRIARLNSKLLDLEFSNLGTESSYMRLCRQPTPSHAILRLWLRVTSAPRLRSLFPSTLDGFLRLRAVRAYRELFERYEPSLVLVPSPGFRYEDQVLLRAAHEFGIPSHCAVSSWDNLTGRGAMKVRPDVLSVWNRPMKDHAVSYHGFPEERIVITGVPQFDIYADPTRFHDKDEVCARVGVSPDRPIFLYLTAKGFSEAERFDLQRIRNLVAMKRPAGAPLPAVVVRVHPNEQRTRFSDLIDGEILYLDPDGLSNEEPAFPDPEFGDVPLPSPAREVWKASLFHTSAAVFASCATTALIEACVLDKPAFLLVEDQRPGVSDAMQRLMRAQLNYTHQTEFQRIGAVEHRQGAEALIDGLWTALERPHERAEHRSRVTEEMCYCVDGRAATRVADLAWQMATGQSTPLGAAMLSEPVAAD